MSFHTWLAWRGLLEKIYIVITIILYRNNVCFSEFNQIICDRPNEIRPPVLRLENGFVYSLKPAAAGFFMPIIPKKRKLKIQAPKLIRGIISALTFCPRPLFFLPTPYGRPLYWGLELALNVINTQIIRDYYR